MLQYSNLMTGNVGLYCDVLVAVGFTTVACNIQTRVTALLCGIKTSTLHYLVLSQSMRVTYGQTELRPQDHARVAASCGKNWSVVSSVRAVEILRYNAVLLQW